jgi:hypothetical protein
MKRLLLSVGLLSLSVGAASAQSFQDMVTVQGDCKFQLVQGFFPCTKTGSYIVFKNGRQAFAFTQGDTLFWLSGNQDRQPNLENFYVQIDTFRMTHKGKTSEDTGMEGECHINMNKDASQFRYIKCDVYNRSKGSLYNFSIDRIKKTDRLKGAYRPAYYGGYYAPHRPALPGLLMRYVAVILRPNEIGSGMTATPPCSIRRASCAA